MNLDFVGEVVAGIAVGGMGVDVASTGVGEIWAGAEQAVSNTATSEMKLNQANPFMVILLASYLQCIVYINALE
jgi:hypothetical protein